MKLLFISSSIFVLSISIFYSSQLRDIFYSFTAFNNTSTPKQAPIHSIATSLTTAESSSMTSINTIKNTMSKALSHAKIVPRRSADRGHANHGWLNTYHTFSFANYYDPRYQNFGSLRVLNEDRVDGGSGFPTHPHRDAEIFSYILSGELTHRDSMIKKGAEGSQGDDFYRMKRGDVQFTTGGSGMSFFSFYPFPLPLQISQYHILTVDNDRHRTLRTKRIERTSPLPPDLGSPLVKRPHAPLPHKDLLRRRQTTSLPTHPVATQRRKGRHTSTGESR